MFAEWNVFFFLFFFSPDRKWNFYILIQLKGLFKILKMAHYKRLGSPVAEASWKFRLPGWVPPPILWFLPPACSDLGTPGWNHGTNRGTRGANSPRSVERWKLRRPKLGLHTQWWNIWDVHMNVSPFAWRPEGESSRSTSFYATAFDSPPVKVCVTFSAL